MAIIARRIPPPCSSLSPPACDDIPAEPCVLSFQHDVRFFCNCVRLTPAKRVHLATRFLVCLVCVDDVRSSFCSSGRRCACFAVLVKQTSSVSRLREHLAISPWFRALAVYSSTHISFSFHLGCGVWKKSCPFPIGFRRQTSSPLWEFASAAEQEQEGGAGVREAESSSRTSKEGGIGGGDGGEGNAPSFEKTVRWSPLAGGRDARRVCPSPPPLMSLFPFPVRRYPAAEAGHERRTGGADGDRTGGSAGVFRVDLPPPLRRDQQRTREEETEECVTGAAGATSAAATGSSGATRRPASAAAERMTPSEFRRLLTPRGSGSEVFGQSAPPQWSAEKEEQDGGFISEDDVDGSGLQDGGQSVSVSVSEERQEVGATTTEDAASFSFSFPSPDGARPGTGGGGGAGVSVGNAGSGGQNTGGRAGMFYSSSGEESIGAGSFGVSSAHGDASGGSGLSSAAAPATVMTPSVMPRQMASSRGREADTSAGASPVPSASRHHALVTGSLSSETASNPAQQQQQQQQQQEPPLPPPPAVAAAVSAVLSPTAGGEASRDGGTARSMDRPIPGVNVDQTATLALRSMIMGGGGGGGSGGGDGGGDGEASLFWSTGGMAGGGGGSEVAASGEGAAGGGGAGALPSVAFPRADAEGAGAGLARPLPSSAAAAAAAAAASAAAAAVAATDPTISSLLSAAGTTGTLGSTNTTNTSSPSGYSALGGSTSVVSTSTMSSVAVAVDGGPAVPFSPAVPPSSSSSSSSSPANGPALHLAGAGAPRGAGRGALTGAGVAASVGLPAPESPPASQAAAAASQGDTDPAVADTRALPQTGLASGSAAGGMAGRAGVRSAAPAGASGGSDSLFSSQPMAERGAAESVGAARGGGRGGVHDEELVEAVAARVTEEMAGKMAALQASMEQSVASCCRQTLMAWMATAEETRAGERAALVGDISSSVDRSVRRGMAETVATPLAKLVVSTARQVVADPLQASMSTLHGQQQRQAQALAAAAAAGAQAGVQSQAAGMATATARAQAGNVRRELLESREELSRDVSRAVADAVQDPVLSAFGECFEGQLIPRIQASKRNAVQRMFEQINDTLTRGLQASPLVNNRATAFAEDVSHVRSRVEGLEGSMQEVATALSGLGVKMERLAEMTLATQQTGLATAASVEVCLTGKVPSACVPCLSISSVAVAHSAHQEAAHAAAVDPREELHRLVSAGRFDEAMNMALSASDLPLVMWLCGRLDPVTTPPTLPQHILLCLVQQFGASNLLEDTTAKLNWLQHCLSALDPMESTIRAHLPVVLRQLKGALASSTPVITQRGGNDVSVVRLTTHVVNSLVSMLPSAGSEGV
ncbi:unnamed protein product [Scytosiphon promiscuus]